MNKPNDQESLLRAAVLCDDSNEAARILENEPKLLKKTTNKTFTPLHLAASLGSAHMVKLLLAYEASVNAQSSFETGKQTALHIAAARNFHSVVEILLSHSADPSVYDARRSTPLHEAAKNGAKEAVQILLQHCNSNPTSVDKDGRSAEFYAKKQGHSEVASLLPSVPFDMWRHLQQQPNFLPLVEGVRATLPSKDKKKDAKGKQERSSQSKKR